jgi:integrase
MQRKKGDGSFRKLPNGSVEFSIDVGYDIYGKRRRKRFYGKTETECRKNYKDFMKGGEKKPSRAKEYKLSEWISLWLETHKKKKVQSTTYDGYVSTMVHVKSHKIGSLKLSQVKPIHVTDYFTSISEYSHSFRHLSRILLNGAFESAVDNDFCHKNPVQRAEIAKKSQPKKEAFTEDETRTILNFARTDKLFGVIIYIMLHTGIRTQEVCALTVKQFDFEKGILTIDRAVKRTGELGSTKNGKTRYIPLNPEVIRFLKPKITKDFNLSTDGLRSRYNWFFNRLNKTLKNLGAEPIKRKSPHATRHTFSTLCQKNGMPIAMVAELLGHSSTAVTDQYTHFKDTSVLAEAVRKYGVTV